MKEGDVSDGLASRDMDSDEQRAEAKARSSPEERRGPDDRGTKTKDAKAASDAISPDNGRRLAVLAQLHRLLADLDTRRSGKSRISKAEY